VLSMLLSLLKLSLICMLCSIGAQRLLSSKIQSSSSTFYSFET
jgi:hypothetical protein